MKTVSETTGITSTGDAAMLPTTSLESGASSVFSPGKNQFVPLAIITATPKTVINTNPRKRLSHARMDMNKTREKSDYGEQPPSF